MIIEINDDDAEELFEILCAIPYREANGFDWEPPTERPAGIDNILDQMCEEFEEDENDIIEVSDYISNVEFTENGMVYDKHTIYKCEDCGETFERVEKNIEWKRNSFLKCINISTTRACSNNYWI